MRVSPRHYLISTAVLALCCTILITGCAVPTGSRQPLPSQRRNRLLNRARFPSQVGVQRTVRDGVAKLDNVYSLPIGSQTVAAFTPRTNMKQSHVPIIDVMVNGKRCGVLLDTASPDSLTTYQTAVLAKINPLAQNAPGQNETVAWELISEWADAPFARLNTFAAMARGLHLGQLKMYNVPMGIINDTRGLGLLPGLAETQPDILLGNDFLSTFSRFSINFVERKVTLASRGVHRPNPKNLVAAGRFNDSFDIPVMQAMFDGKGPFPVAIATGGEFGFILPKYLAEDAGLVEIGDEPNILLGTGMTTVPCVELGSKTLDLSGFELHDVNALAVDTSAATGLLPYGLLGGRALKNFIVTIDYTAKRIYFESPDIPQR